MSDRIDQIRERLDNATPGPWDHIESTYRDRPAHRIGNPDINVDVALVWRWGDSLSLATAEFIAHAPDDVAWLLDKLAEAWDEGRKLGLQMADWENGARVNIPCLANPYRKPADG